SNFWGKFGRGIWHSAGGGGGCPCPGLSIGRIQPRAPWRGSTPGAASSAPTVEWVVWVGSGGAARRRVGIGRVTWCFVVASDRRRLVHPSLGRVHPVFGTPMVAIALMAFLTVAAAMFGDAILVPVTEVGSLAVGVGWLSACLAYLARRRNAAESARQADGAES